MTSVPEPMAGATSAEPASSPLPIVRRRWEAADTVIALVVALIVTIFAVFVALCFQGYATTLATAQTRAQDAANVVAQEVRWLTGSVQSSLDLIETKLSLLPLALTPADRADLDSTLRFLPEGTSLAIYDAQGLAVPNGGSADLPTDISGAEYFPFLTGDEWQILPNGKNGITGEPAIVFARGLGTDVFAGAALLAVSADVLRQFREPLKLGADSSVNLVRSDGWIVGRDPPLAEARNVSESSPFWPEVSVSETGTYTATSQLDGITRIVGYRSLKELGLVVFATVAQDTIMRGLWTSIWIVTALLVPFAIVLLLGSLWTARLLRRSARTQRTLAAAVAHNEVLFREIHHRVKNNLQSVASLLQMQPIPREIKENMGQRIAAMSAVHEHIYRSNDFETVRVRDYLATLIASLRGGHDPRVSVIEQLEDLSVDRDAATPLGLIVNEVVSNAFKHAFTDGRAGEIAVRLTRAENGLGQLVIEDNGMGFDPEAPAKGIGRRLIKALTHQIGGSSRFETAANHGSRFTLEFPLAQRLMG
jgi:two-component system, sensor histidine kinase PdtaS